jgi:hypothetical protein
MKRLPAIVLLLGLNALAQTLVEISTVVAVQSTLFTAIKFPSGSYKAAAGSQEIIARIPNGAKYKWEVSVAKGTAARLHDAFVHQIATAFASNGFFQEEQKTQQVNGENRTLYTFKDDLGQTALLFVVRKGDELVFAVGK